MGILSSILGKFFPNLHTDTTAATTPTSTGAPASPQAPASAPAVAPMAEVDVEQMLNDMSQKSAEKLNWKTSIVDLMKLLGLDSSLTARKQLATELHYAGDMNDSATMNIWLHRQVMNKLAANGGKVPADLKD